ncbi:MAG: reverse transcriptase [Bacteroidetes bacterium]|nr:reverse transcriptase [Bacteroidota bacterium]
MKRIGYLIEKVADPDNLRLAYWKAQKGKEAKPEIIKYLRELETNLQIIRKQILSGSIEIGNYRLFTIYDPKERQICAAPFAQRVLHHALMNICHPYLEKKQIFDSYASRLCKGTYAALNRAASFTNKYTWFLKLDVRKYFDNINHVILKEQLSNMFKDERLLQIFYAIIDSYEVSDGKGLPIGNLTSQYFANHYLSVADHFVKEKLEIPAYVRYMDDMVLWHNDKNTLLEKGKIFEMFISKELDLKLKPFCFNSNNESLQFLGYLLHKNKIQLAQRSKRRFINKITLFEHKLKDGLLSQKEYQQHVLPLVSFTQYAEARGFREKIISQLGQVS